jgi:hypothetical protein
MGICGCGGYLPSSLTKESYAKNLLCARTLGIIFVVDERIEAIRRDCSALQHWLGTVADGARAGTEKNNGRDQGAR